jgi:cysteine desulfurase/selenocysteine lyase
MTSAGARLSDPRSGRQAAAPDLTRHREDFPILATQVRGKPLVYLDNAASTQKPRVVIDAERRCYEEYYANVHRGVHQLSQRSTDAYEGARETVRRFLNAGDVKEIVFTRGTTESINLVASSFVRPGLQAGDEILLTAMEHHANIVPWQLLREEKGAVLKVAPIDDAGELKLDELEALMSPRTKLVAVGHVSNALGTVNPVERIIEMAHARGIPVLVDGAQAVSHLPVDVRELGCDFYAFSGHKVFGPTGIGVLWGRAELLHAMPPYQGGGDMILSVTFERTVFNGIPWKFEAGTPHIAGAIGLGAALDYVSELGRPAIAAWEEELLGYGNQALATVPGLRMIGTAKHKAAVFSFLLDGIHPHDIGTILDYEGIAIRTGHHCAQPVMERFGIPATARASLAFYNTRQEIDALVRGLHKVREMFA